MSKRKKSIKELNLIEDFLFTEASVDAEAGEILMRLIIERATSLKVGKLLIEPQKIINGVDTNCHGIRLDVSVKELTEEGNTIQLFDIEPNNITKVHLPKRSRFYQALTDVKLLETGVDYDMLPDMWTIWILPYDPFGMDFMLYSVKNVVEDNLEIEYNDGVRKLFLYTKGKKGGTQSLKNLLTYIETSKFENAVDEDLKKLHSNVERLKINTEIGARYMNMQEVIKYQVEEEVEEIVAGMKEQLWQEAKERAEKEVKEQVTQQVTEQVTQQVSNDVEQRIMNLTKQLLNAGRYEDLKRLTEDESYRKTLLEEMGLKK